MHILILLILGPALAGLLVAAVWRMTWGRRAAGAHMIAAFAGAVAGVIAVAALIAPNASILLPFDVPFEVVRWVIDVRFATPLVCGIIGLVILALPLRARRSRGVAGLARRTPLTFLHGGWLIAPGIAVAIIVALTLAAGAASEPDTQTGQYTMYMVDLGGERAMGTGIYGWFYSVPALLLLAMLIALVVVDLVILSRPAMADGVENDDRARRQRARAIVGVASGALLVHLGGILGSLAGTASVRSRFSTSEGSVGFFTPFAALGPTMQVASNVLLAFGFAAWFIVAFSGIPRRRGAGRVGSHP